MSSLLSPRAHRAGRAAKKLFERILKKQEQLIVHNYIIVETSALLFYRLGHASARAFLSEVERFPIVWVDTALHRRAAQRFDQTKKRRVSFVDCVSFVLMERNDVKIAFAFDDDFLKEGFALYKM